MTSNEELTILVHDIVAASASRVRWAMGDPCARDERTLRDVSHPSRDEVKEPELFQEGEEDS